MVSSFSLTDIVAFSPWVIMYQGASYWLPLPGDGAGPRWTTALAALASGEDAPIDSRAPRATVGGVVDRLMGPAGLDGRVDLAILLLDNRKRHHVLLARGFTKGDLAPFTTPFAVPERPKDTAILTLRDGSRDLGLLVLRPARGASGPILDGFHPVAVGLANSLGGLLGRLLTQCHRALDDLQAREAEETSRESMAFLAEARDPDTNLHVTRMGQYVEIIARAMGLDDDQCDVLRRASVMHDVGKVAIPDSILLKRGPLTAEEYEAMKAHAAVGAGMIAGRDHQSRLAREVALTHHEKWDGSGYPKGLTGMAIPLSGRICALADVFDALTSERPYKDAWPFEEAVAHVVDQAGRHFDPDVVSAFLGALDEARLVHTLYQAGTVDPWLDLPSHLSDRPMSWRETYSVGIDVIDEHHRFLFELVDRLYGALDRGGDVTALWSTFKALEAYWTIHFQAEEEMLEAHGYPDLARHRMRHRIFQDRIRFHFDTFLDCPLLVGKDVAAFLRSWLVNHILTMDRGMKDALVRV
jgi:hemerythrin-like metal-binding protein